MRWYLPSIALGKVYFLEKFDADWDKRWVLSEHDKARQGSFELATGKFFLDEAKNKGLMTMDDSRLYGVSANFEEFSNADKTLIIQYQVKYEKDIDCGGGYIKVGPKIEDQTSFKGETKYNIMFGPDKCGYDKRTHLIFSLSPELTKNVLKTKQIDYKQTKQKSHLYRLTLNPDNTVMVEIDGKEEYKGNLKEDWEMLEKKEINDPDDKKPDDWVDEEMIADPESKKPDDWVEEKRIPDPDAKKPEDWDEKADGEWEPPMKDNPDYKGEWTPGKIKNPAFKGKWKPRIIPNPNFVDNNELYKYEKFGFVGIDLWQVTAGAIFDNILITDDVEEANKMKQEWDELQAHESREKEKEEEEQKAQDEAKAKASKKSKDDDDDDDDADDDDDEDL